MHQVLCSILLKANFIVLTILCFVPLPLSIVGSQSYVTTTIQTSSIATYTIGSSVITSVSQPQLLVNRSFTVFSTTGTSDDCEVANFTFYGSRGQFVSGNFSSTVALDFYVMTDTAYQNLLTLRNCGSVSAVDSRQNTMNYDFNVALPDSGLWDIVLVNHSNTRNATGFLVAYLTFGTFITSEPLVTTIIQTIPVQTVVREQGAILSSYSLSIIMSMIAIVFIIVFVASREILKKKHRMK
jgi:hypothetical protein